MTAQLLTQTEYTVAGSAPLTEEALGSGALYEATGPLGVVLRYGRLISYPAHMRENVLMMPVLRYGELGYTDPAQVDQLENFNTYDQATRHDVHVTAMDPYGTILFNVNFVRGIIPLPTEVLFDLTQSMRGHVTKFIEEHRSTLAEPSRLVAADPRKYKTEFQNGLNPLELYSIARSMLGIGIDLATRSMGIEHWLFNYDPKYAGNFVKALTGGHELVALPNVTIQPEAYTGPFGPYFTDHLEQNQPLFVTLSNAIDLSLRMGNTAREDLNKRYQYTL